MMNFLKVGNRLIVKSDDVRRLYEVCTFVDEEASYTTFSDGVKVSIIDNADKTIAMIKFADEHYDDIISIICESSFVFADIYRNPEILQLYLNRSGTQQKPELKTKDSMRRAIDKYNSKFAEIKIRIKPDVKDKIKSKAQQNGMSLQAYIISLIETDLN